MKDAPDRLDNKEKTTEDLIADLRSCASTLSATVLERDKLFEDFALFTQVGEDLNNQYELLMTNGHVPSNEFVSLVALTNTKVHLAACFKSMVREKDINFTRMVALMENPSALFFPDGLQDTVAGESANGENQLIDKLGPTNTSDKVEVLKSLVQISFELRQI
ncbi:hypothetical protein KIN20_036225 [Parelaphostrongylus tenuis]|uniref:Uncharacterized protein n=1 Tax=Parelaphostrongylus tenuis TaxID=148309 RepID=A0AAD5WKH3_PARTN|nr:hypothetical protein KIN20_036225 [Parelaphostrongylus tenuis]